MAELKWVAERCQTVLLPALEAASTEEAVKQIGLAELAFWQEKFPDTPNSWRTPHTQSRKIVRTSALPAQTIEWTLQYMNLGDEKWTEINRPSGPALADRLEHQILLQDPDRIVVQANALLVSDRWQDLAAGIVMATGRRATEILKTARFERATAYSVLFHGQIKHKLTNSFEIPTLCEAGKVVDAMERLRDVLDTEEMTEHEVSNAFHRALGKSVKQHFEGIIPAREDESISPQTLRSVYLRLAIFFYAPLLVDAETFAAEISGHRSKGEGQEDQRSYGAAPHYAEYKIADAAGQIDGRQGVKLGQPGVEVLTVFSRSHNGASPVLAASRPIVAAGGVLTAESLLAGAELQTVLDGMEAANITDFTAYLKAALKRQARTDLGMARRDTLADVASMSMEDLAKTRKPATASERIRRAVAAIANYNDTHVQLERWFVNATLLSNLIGGRFETIMAWLEEHKIEVDEINTKYDLTTAYNRKPVDVKLVIEVK
ncbi:MAG: protelomerase family protein [Ktedonobacteraceae bacterium]